MKVLILANFDGGLYKFRRQLLEALNARGHEVYAALPFGENIDKIEKTGCKCIKVEFSRRGTSPAGDLELYKTYKKLLKSLKPDVVLTYTIKPNVYGGIAAAKLKIPCIANVTGLGTAIENPGLLRTITLTLYRRGLAGVRKVFFQNESNEAFFTGQHIAEGRHALLPGSGVDVREFRYTDYPDYEEGKDRFLFVGRIMKDKGIEELVTAARNIRKKYPDITFDVVGEMDEDYSEKLREWEEEKVINYIGHIADVKPYYTACSAVVLPTYHEGMANVLLEGSSMGRPVIASNIPGCRETFDEAVTGFGFEPKNSESLEQALTKFIELPADTKKKMGAAARTKVENQFDRQIVVGRYISEIEGIT